MMVISCESFLEVDPPKTEISNDILFQNENTAEAVVIGLYARMAENPLSFSNAGLTLMAGLSADELEYHGSNPEYREFYENALQPTNSQNLRQFWQRAYSLIYAANAAIEGLSSQSPVRAELREKLVGEAKFIRAWTYFNLASFYGDVPLVTHTDWRRNHLLPRATVETVYEQIIIDLQDAESALSEELSTEGPLRVNKFAAAALLSRVYLYRGRFVDAEAKATEVISAAAGYQLETSLDEVFLLNSREAIWALQPVLPEKTTGDASLFVRSQGVPVYGSITASLLGAFDPADERRQTWVGSYQQGGVTYYFPYKYKATFPEQIAENTIVLRLAEQFLIRAEARAQLSDIAGAIADLDVIRTRAGLSRISDTAPEMDKDQVLAAIIKERRVEFFAEWGHRWLDLKRHNLIDELAATKPSVMLGDLLYPIPQLDRNNNPNLTQNEGY